MGIETLLGIPLALSLLASSIVLLLKTVLDVNAKYREQLFTSQFHHYRLFTEPRAQKLFACAVLFAQLKHLQGDLAEAAKKGDEIRALVLGAAPFFGPALSGQLIRSDYTALGAADIDGILELLHAQTPPEPVAPYVLDRGIRGLLAWLGGVGSPPPA